MTSRRTIPYTLMLALFAAPPSRAQDTKCWGDWSEAAGIVRQEALATAERVAQAARLKHPGADVIKTTLCEEHGKFVYRLLLRERRGQLTTVLMDARNPDAP
jgi:uncharacterized membrane protein YkoI